MAAMYEAEAKKGICYRQVLFEKKTSSFLID